VGWVASAEFSQGWVLLSTAVVVHMLSSESLSRMTLLLTLECCVMAEAVLRLGHADRQLVKAHRSEALQANTSTQHQFCQLRTTQPLSAQH
jgi:hypothetical protein